MEKIIAAIRIRPAKSTDPDEIGITKSGERGIIAKKHSDKFSFESVYDQPTTNVEIFNGTVKPILERAVKGYNVCIFTYGQTSSGKTYTMKGTTENPGIIPLALKFLFEKFNEEKKLRSGNGAQTGKKSLSKRSVYKSGRKSTAKKRKKIERNVSLEYIEIYNETINDLLKHKNHNLRLRMKPDKSLFVEGLSENKVENCEEALDRL